MFYKKNKIKKGSKRVSGRNNQGKITIRHQGGGFKKKAFFVDSFRSFSNLTFFVLGFFSQSPLKASFVLLKGPQEQRLSILNVKGLEVGFSINNVFKKECTCFFFGSSYFLGSLPVGSFIHNVEKQPYLGGKLVKSAGCFAVVLQKASKVLLKIPSGKLSSFSPNSRVSFGQVNSYVKLNKLKKAGQSRLFGIRPSVRGVAINSVDHPHGGGEGKSYLGRVPVSPWGSLIKGKRQ